MMGVSEGVLMSPACELALQLQMHILPVLVHQQWCCQDSQMQLGFCSLRLLNRRVLGLGLCLGLASRATQQVETRLS